MKIKNLIWIIVIIILLSNLISAEEMSSSNNKYVYNQAPDSVTIGSKIEFNQEENKISAPLIGYNIEGNQTIKSVILNLNDEINISGKACIVREITRPTWTEVMDNLENTCVNFYSNANNITFNIDYNIENSYLNIVIIPESGEGNTNVVDSIITTSGTITPNPIPEPNPVPNPTPTPQPKPTPEPTQYQELTTCKIESINFNKTESSTKVPSNLIVKTNNCNNSIIKIKIFKKDIGHNSIVSEKQTIISNKESQILWVADNPGTYYASAESENIMTSNNIKIKEFNIKDMKKNKKFHEVISNIHQIAQVDKKTAKEVCDSMPTSAEADACLEDLASYVKDKRLCAGIENKNKKESCYTMFALEGDISGCIYSKSKSMCIMLGILTRTNDINLTIHKDQYKQAIVMKKKKSNNIISIVIILTIIAALFYLITELINKKVHKKKKN